MVDAEAVVRAFCAAWGEGNVERPAAGPIADMFAEDGEWRVWVPGGDVIKGRETIRREIERQSAFSTYMQCGIEKLIVSGSTVMTERVDHFTMRGTRVEHALVAVYDLDADGKILSWREYFDTADIGKQLGLNSDELMAG